jgi:hypothetical protein
MKSLKLKFGAYKGVEFSKVPLDYKISFWKIFETRYEKNQLVKQKRVQEFMNYLSKDEKINSQNKLSNNNSKTTYSRSGKRFC